MNSKSNETFESHRLLFNLSNKINLKRIDKYVPLPKYSICYTWENINQSYKNNKFKISAATWTEEFELPDRSHSVLDIQDYFEYLKKHGEKTSNPSIRVYINKTENRITFIIKAEYYIGLLIPERMILFESNKGK